MSAWFGRVGAGKDALPDNKPSVWLVTDASFKESDAKAVGAGCEEEGVPLAWFTQNAKNVGSGSSSELARVACLRSRLETGIGICPERKGAIALFSVADAPYLERDVNTPSRLRWLGQTAARISKGEPIMYETEGVDGHE
ncbi:MAG: glycerol dehydratase reactivase beta/small subunit family protein [Synergistaceae bacterium]|jgi:hypothetical protein|nr:glycerol dehydratase reactivase beta/small subunit family protein [Synergistaceae bacterium]